MSKKDENKVANLICQILNLEFEKGIKLGKWGIADKHAKINDKKFLFLEVETSQKHPDTNVLKYWPYLEENRKIKIFLIHSFLTNEINRNGSRINLAEWLANKLQKRFGKRFYYHRIFVSQDYKNIADKKLLKEKIEQFCRKD